MQNNGVKSENGTGLVARSLTAGSLRAIAYYVTLNYIIPIGIPIATGYVGYLQGLPWMHIMVGSGLMFSGVATGLVRFDEWVDRRRVKDKLQFVEIRYGRNALGPGVFLGVRLVNRAAIPIEVNFVSIRTRLADRVPVNTNFEVRKFKVLPGNFVWLDDHFIAIESPPSSGALEGFIEFDIDYGRVGALNYHLSQKKQVVARFNSDRLLEGGSWSDAA